MLDDIFNIDHFNVYSDNDYYYFFRALEELDIAGIKDGSIVDNNGNIMKLITDREYYNLSDRYGEDSNISLEEIFNHIKMHYSKDTNCISFSSNANVALTYGRKEYNDQYVILKVKKDEMNKSVYNAGLYMMQEISKRIDDIVDKDGLDDLQKYYFDFINNAKTQEQLDQIKMTFPADYVNDDLLEKGFDYILDSTKTIDYQALSEKQNLEKNKLVLKIDVLDKNIINNVSNRFLIQTLGNAFSSLEVIHYKDVDGKNLIRVSNEYMDALALLQQVSNNEQIEEIKNIVISKINDGYMFPSFHYNEYKPIEDSYSIENIYNMTNGQIDYGVAVNLYKKAFYLAKSRLRSIKSVLALNELLGDNPKYFKILKDLALNTYGIEPEIITRTSSNKIKVSESVSLDFNTNEVNLFEYINKMSRQELLSFMDNPSESFKKIIETEKNIIPKSPFKTLEDYYANTIIDLFDWKKVGIQINFSYNQRMDIINALKDNNFMLTYNIFKNQGMKDSEIAGVLLTSVIKNKEDVSTKELFTIAELEDFIGYNRIKGSRLVLRDYQATAYKNINKTFKSKQFTTAVLPTGAGKSFVALAEMSQYKDNKILYLAPSEEILNQIKKYIWDYYAEPHIDKTEEEVIRKVFPNLEFSTYAYLTSDNATNLIENQYDLIVFDELHRTGATEWNSKINNLLANQTKQVKILGITATPQRDADMMDMAEHWAKYYGYSKEEIAKHKHLAVNLDLVDAIKLRYVVNPKIVNCEYTLLNDGSMDSLQSQIEATGDKEKIEKYEQLRRNLDKSKGIDEVLANNLKPGGKYIVFCPVTGQKGQIIENIDGLSMTDNITGNLVIDQYTEYLKNNISKFIFDNNLNMDTDIEISSMLGSYSSYDNKTNLNNFASNDNKTKFMVVMNKLNEGVHVGNIDGIIWLRPMDENSKILYLQQLGRCIFGINPNEDFPEKLRPMVIDLVNNTLKVNINKEYEKTNDLDLLIIIQGWINEHGHLPDLNSDDRVESTYARKLRKIQKEYSKYIDDKDIIQNYDESYRLEIDEILRIGNNIDLWEYEFTYQKNRKYIGEENSDTIVNPFELKGTIRDFVELGEFINNINSIEERLKEIVEKIAINPETGKFDKKYVPKKRDAIRFYDDSAVVGMWIISYKERIIELSDTNEDAKMIAEAKGWLNSVTIEESLKEIVEKIAVNPETGNFDRDYFPKQRDNIRFADGSVRVGNWIQYNKKKILEISDYNKNAQLIAEAKGWLNSVTIEERLKEIVEKIAVNPDTGKFDKEKLPKGKNATRFLDDSSVISMWIYDHKDKIIQLSESNENARLIAETKGWVNNVTIEDRLREIVEKIAINPKTKKFDNKYVPRFGRGIRFAVGSPKVYGWIQNNKKKIIELSDYNKNAQLIAEAQGWINKVTIEDRLKEIVEKMAVNPDTGKFDINYFPKQRDNIRFAYGSVRVGNWIQYNKKKIIELSDYNKNAQLIAEVQGWLNSITIEERLKEIVEKIAVNPDTGKFDINYFPKQKDNIRFADGSAKVGVWIQGNRDKIIELSVTNKNAQLIAEVQGWINKATIEDRLKEIVEKIAVNPETGKFDKEYVPKKRDVIRFYDDSSVISAWIQHNKDKIIELSETNEEAKMIAEAKGWLNSVTLEDRLKEIVEKIAINPETGKFDKEKLPRGNSTTRFADGSAIVGKWIRVSKERIIELSETNEDAKMIAEAKGWLNSVTLEERLKEIVENIAVNPDTGKFDEKFFPKQTDNIRFADGSAKVGVWIQNNKEKIVELSSMNEYSRFIAVAKGWIQFELSKSNFDSSSKFSEVKEMVEGMENVNDRRLL